MTESKLDVFRFWGKAQHLQPECGPGWHPLIFHCLDVAAVGEALLAKHRRMGDHLARLLGLEREETARLATWLLCLHDVGKLAKKFQAKDPDLYPPCFGDDPARLSGFYDHGAGGLRLFDADDGFFKLPSGTRPRTWRPLVSAVTGHHGAPPDTGRRESIVTLKDDFGAAGIEAARLFVGKAHDLFGIPRDMPPLRRERVRPASYALAGLAVLADWIGSNQEWFPYRGPDDFQDLDSYWNHHARARSERAIEEAGVLPAAPRVHLDQGALIGERAVPTPMQEWARIVELPTGPTLFMIEDETGSGKTEAALILAHRLMASGRADGLYMALPTMATANAMFDRLGVAHRKLFAEGAEPSVALAHDARDMHEGFRSAVLHGGRGEAPYSDAGERGGSEITASTACAHWIADDRRRAFLADAGAGTVDQALLSILPSRHQSLRLLGLMRRVLILDEVHACDAYMQREIERLLEFQAGLGGCAILLSATLPLSIRARLADAFARGLGEQEDADRATGGDMAYPMATVRAAGVQTASGVPGRPGHGRTLPVRFLRTPDEALAEVEQAARAGKAVLYIRNTVDDALSAHAALAARGLDPDLFHARFALEDRLKIERRVVKAFGKPFGKHGTPAERAGKVLIATQVVEQSLDLDFDVLITDLAPIDLLIQRAGRLWRHERREREGRPELLVVGPEPEADAKEDWFSNAFPRAAYVYRDHARLWLTARTLEDTGAIESPGGLRSLVEAVYGDDAERGLPDELEGSFFDAEGRAGAERSVATTNVLEFAKGYVRDGGAWDTDVRTPTRLADDPRVTLRLARVRDGRIEPYAQDAAPDESWRAWRLSEVAVSARRVGGEAAPPEQAEAVREAKETWTRYDADKILVVLGEAAAADAPLSGSATSGATASKEVVLGYDPRKGLAFDA